MEANRQSLISRGACVALVLSCLVPVVEYLGALEPTRKSLLQMFMKMAGGEHPQWLMAAWFVPPACGALRLAGFAWKAHVYLAATAVALAIAEFFLAVVGPDHPSFNHMQVYFGLEGVVPDERAGHWGFHATIVGGVAAVWLFDELRAMRVYKAFDAK